MNAEYAAYAGRRGAQTSAGTLTDRKGPPISPSWPIAMITTTPKPSGAAGTAGAGRAHPARWRSAGSAPSAPTAPWCAPACGAPLGARKKRLGAGPGDHLVDDPAALP